MWVPARLVSLTQWFLKYTRLYTYRFWYMSHSAAMGMQREQLSSPALKNSMRLCLLQCPQCHSGKLSPEIPVFLPIFYVAFFKQRRTMFPKFSAVLLSGTRQDLDLRAQTLAITSSHNKIPPNLDSWNDVIFFCNPPITLRHCKSPCYFSVITSKIAGKSA